MLGMPQIAGRAKAQEAAQHKYPKVASSLPCSRCFYFVASVECSYVLRYPVYAAAMSHVETCLVVDCYSIMSVRGVIGCTQSA